MELYHSTNTVHLTDQALVPRGHVVGQFSPNTMPIDSPIELLK
jgi:hypothetical protein